ncbi:MAG: hypothetical protein HY927_14715 [Elusimicrobia bacterium]|nr:hypothetical protein [Elusimicrobiota bacterium]
MSSRSAAALLAFGLAASPGRAAMVERVLPGTTGIGCDMSLAYDPGAFKWEVDVDTVSDFFGGVAGIFTDPAGGRWRLDYWLGNSCDPGFFLVSLSSAGVKQVEVTGESARIESRRRVVVRDSFNLFFPVERVVSFQGSTPRVSGGPFFPVRRATRLKVETPLYRARDGTAPERRLPKGAAVTVISYAPQGVLVGGGRVIPDRALIKTADGKRGWIDCQVGAEPDGLSVDTMEGVSYHGD